MHNKHWLRLILAGFLWAAFLAAPGLPLPGADRLGFSGTAAAQETIDIDTFYDELAPYGQWVWHPRYGYVWLPETVSANWRPYTVGRWTYTDEYGWYWDSYEPFAWAVYHYGRWGYDPDYGWFWVPGDTWAPAWVQWRYSDEYVGWAPIGPRRPGYAYGVPVSYDPPIAESWVFVQPRYMSSRAISYYALPVAGLNVAFIGATNVYRPGYRGGVVYNYGIPRDRVVKIIKRPIYVEKVYKVDNWKGGQFDKGGPNRGIRIYAPGVARDDKPDRGPKKFADNPNDFKPKAKLKNTFNGDVPKGWGPSVKGVTPIAEAGPDAFKKHGQFGGPNNEQANRNDRDRDNDKGEGEASKGFGGPGGPNQFKEGNRDLDDRGGGDQGKPKGFGGPGGPGGPGAPNQFKQGNRGNNDQGGGQSKPKGFGGPGGPNQFKQGNRDQDIQGGGQGKPKGFGGPGGPGGPNNFKSFGGQVGPGGPGGQGQGGRQGGQQAEGQGCGDKDKCKKHPEKPGCQNQN